MDAGGYFQDLKATTGDVDFASVGGQGLGQHYPSLLLSELLDLCADRSVMDEGKLGI